jgi:hypothetical protein
MTTTVLPGDQQPPGFPFRGPGLAARAVPFAVVAVLAEISLGLPPGVQSPAAVIASIVLLLAVPASFALPWERLPGWAPALVPLVCTVWAVAAVVAVESLRRWSRRLRLILSSSAGCCCGGCWAC